MGISGTTENISPQVPISVIYTVFFRRYFFPNHQVMSIGIIAFIVVELLSHFIEISMTLPILVANSTYKSFICTALERDRRLP